MIVLDADVLGRHRTGEETYLLNLLRRLPLVAPDLRFAAVTRHPELVPDGVEPLDSPGAFAGAAHVLVAAAAPAPPAAGARRTSSMLCRSAGAARAS